MTAATDTIKYKFDRAVEQLTNRDCFHDINFFKALYITMFGSFPNTICLDSDGIYLNKNASIRCYEEDDDDDIIDEEQPSLTTYTNIKVSDTLIKLYEKYHDDEVNAYTFRMDITPVIILHECIIHWNEYFGSIIVLQNSDKLDSRVAECIVDNNNEDDRYFNYITISNSGGFVETPMKVKNQNINLSQNYNDDLPHDDIVDFLKGNKSGLILLHGIPGTGKTSYIRHLMYEIKNRKFLVLDSAIFNYINNSNFVNLLLNNKNSIIILEDCEDMLADRIAGNNHLTTLLNLSDGIIGDSFNFKFICTFNANITKIDKAILRKGRMRLKYEFKALCADKTKKLAESLNRNINEGESLTLADIYNYNLNNGGETIKTAKIGFTQ